MINVCKKRAEFLEYFPNDSVGMEIGAFKGEFSKLILKIIQPTEFHLIDVWWLLYGEHYPDWGIYTDYGNLKTKDAYQQTLNNINGFEDTCKVHVGNDLKIIYKFPDHYFDWVYIDSSHNYEHTINELFLLDSKLKENGLLTGHDWQPDVEHIHHGVYKAVVEFCEATTWRVIYLDNHTQWALKRID